MLPVGRVGGDLPPGDRGRRQRLRLQPDEQHRRGQATRSGWPRISLCDFLARLARKPLAGPDGQEHKGWVYDAAVTPTPRPAKPSRPPLSPRSSTSSRRSSRPTRPAGRSARAFFAQLDDVMRGLPQPVGHADPARGLRRRPGPLRAAGGRPAARPLLHGAHGGRGRAGSRARARPWLRAAVRSGGRREVGRRPTPGQRAGPARDGGRAVCRADAAAGGVLSAVGDAGEDAAAGRRSSPASPRSATRTWPRPGT